MNHLKLKSISQLIVAGFLLVAAPLVLMLVQVGISIDRLANQSERAVLQAVEATNYSRMLVEQAIAMERNARQFHVLGGEDLYYAYHDNHQSLRTTIEELGSLKLIPTQRILLDQLIEKEKHLSSYYDDIKMFKVSLLVAKEFGGVTEKAQAILHHNNKLVDTEVSQMQSAATDMQNTFYIQGAAFLPMVVLLAGFFVFIISRLLKEMDEAIRRLGEGEFDRPIFLKGPKDIEFLGERLNWLRTRLSEVEAHKLKFLRHISHELKTPLTNIREGSELLTEELVGPLNSNQKEITKIIVDNGVQLQKLIEDLLRFGGAKNDADGRNLKYTSFSLDEVVNEVLEKNKLALVAKKIRIDRTYKSPIISADMGKIHVVVDNLISNACKHSPIGGTIRVATASSREYAMLGVNDDGPGIAPDERVRIFEAFYQGKGEYVSHVKGTGLGLSIAKEYVEAHRGSVEAVDSKHGGAYFIVKIPRLTVERLQNES